MGTDERTRALVERAVSGDRLSVQCLIVMHHDRLREIAAAGLGGRLRAKVEPEDVLQEVYAEAVRRIGEFEYRGEDAFFHWLRRILESRLVDARRRYRGVGRDAAREAPAPESPSAYDRLVGPAGALSETPSRIARQDEARAVLMGALAGLTEEHRRVLELRFLRGLSLARVAEVMDRTPAAAQMLCGRAVRDLKETCRQLTRAIECGRGPPTR